MMNKSLCKKCKAPIIWVKTRLGANMPIDDNGTWNGELLYKYGLHTPHWATCPYAAEFKNRRVAFGGAKKEKADSR